MATSDYIKYGDTGEGVKNIQKQLAQAGYQISVDGVFGPKTQDALRKFQSAQGIQADAIYGQQTAGAFQKLFSTPTTPVATGTTPLVPTIPTTTVTPSPSPQTPTVPTATTAAPFTYDQTADPLYKAQAALVQSQLAQQMAARGISGSTIEQERTAQALGALGLDYRTQALNQYNTERAYQQELAATQYQQQRQAKEDAWTTAQERGYFNNDEAMLWGVEPGTQTQSEKARKAAEEQVKKDEAFRQEQLSLSKQELELSKAAAEKKGVYETGSSAAYKYLAPQFVSTFANAQTEEQATQYVKSLLDQVVQGNITVEELNLLIGASGVNDIGIDARKIVNSLLSGTPTTPEADVAQNKSAYTGKQGTLYERLG